MSEEEADRLVGPLFKRVHSRALNAGLPPSKVIQGLPGGVLVVRGVQRERERHPLGVSWRLG